MCKLYNKKASKGILEYCTAIHNIVHFLLKEFASQGLEGRELYGDLEGKRVNGVTIPPDVAMTAQKPDLVIINRKAPLR